MSYVIPVLIKNLKVGRDAESNNLEMTLQLITGEVKDGVLDSLFKGEKKISLLIED